MDRLIDLQNLFVGLCLHVVCACVLHTNVVRVA